VFLKETPGAYTPALIGAAARVLKLEGDFVGLCLAVFVAQMPVSFHAQCVAVLMSKPVRNSRDVHAVFNATGGKQVAQVVVGDSLRAGQFGGSPLTAGPFVVKRRKSFRKSDSRSLATSRTWVSKERRINLPSTLTRPK